MDVKLYIKTLLDAGFFSFIETNDTEGFEMLLSFRKVCYITVHTWN